MSTLRKKCFPKLSRLRKDLWSWHSDIESLMQGLNAPKKNALVKDENPEDKMNAKCFEMIHKLCRMSVSIFLKIKYTLIKLLRKYRVNTSQ